MHGRAPVLISLRLRPAAQRFPLIVFRIKASRNIGCQLPWATSSSPQSEANNMHFPVKASGDFPGIRVRLADNPRWHGIKTSLRFDPGSRTTTRLLWNWSA